ncbi:hypothetical protein EXQ31_09725 [Clostridium botulinum]|uniref:DNA-directed RNA polymerase M/15kDa subunit domain-containing protein n=2 Tax=Clostridium botulinum TaxID=1491 RepID=A0A846I0A4_CLOBO|nr:hypothetical protein [Clostridium botulinum]ACQ51210.1 conserved hypothetical protein [Clostridium botulinum Ba4 str. 657]AXG90274.1 hypothetical protein AGE29_00190 [Clostridium botulinum]MBO0526637.1 hypothetical protein [Clostridium botulinum]MBO0528051.1 hypothetical protein [Clostridium botulinum]MBO0532541.1 hypothetical protein [Clostridium botulinum]
MKNRDFCKHCGEKMFTRTKENKRNNKIIFLKVCPICGYTIRADISEVSAMESFNSEKEYYNTINNIALIRNTINLKL